MDRSTTGALFGLARRVSLGLAIAGGLFGGITFYALEGLEVVELRTRTAMGDWRTTRVWVAEVGRDLWVEAATPERPFYLDLLVNRELEVIRGGVVQRRTSLPLGSVDGHTRIRELLRERYGWADWWIGLLQDTRQSVALRLGPVE